MYASRRFGPGHRGSVQGGDQLCGQQGRHVQRQLSSHAAGRLQHPGQVQQQAHRRQSFHRQDHGSVPTFGGLQSTPTISGGWQKSTRKRYPRQLMYLKTVVPKQISFQSLFFFFQLPLTYTFIGETSEVEVCVCVYMAKTP